MTNDSLFAAKETLGFLSFFVQLTFTCPFPHSSSRHIRVSGCKYVTYYSSRGER